MLTITSEINELIAKAGKEITRLCDWYRENEEAFDMMDLKLHDVSYYCFKDFELEFPASSKKYNSNDLFNWFCEEKYEEFNDWCKEETGQELRQHQTYVGRTSKFYLHDGNLLQFERCKINWFWTMNAIMETFYNSYGTEIEFDSDGDIDIEGTFDKDIERHYLTSEEEILDAIMEELEYISSDMFKNVTETFVDTLKIYKYLKDFKANQVEYFKEWLGYYEDQAIAEREKADAYAAERIRICDQFEDRAIMSMIINSNLCNEGIQYLVNYVKGTV